ncbi:hypothetical protein, partial [Accumulibacter sp.]|uniref:hypothetical protein n=1 Tax=Accumulibacter sp. TaxID=2053492 RepID=UPI002C21B9FF
RAVGEDEGHRHFGCYIHYVILLILNLGDWPAQARRGETRLVRVRKQTRAFDTDSAEEFQSFRKRWRSNHWVER